MSRKYDVIVWGATGFTGSYVVEYLAESSPADLRWAIAGRSDSKLRELRTQVVDRLSKLFPSRAAEKNAFANVANVDIVIADSADQKSVDVMVAQTKVVIACVGPFVVHGTPAVEACARLGNDYVDITGEAKWVMKMWQAYDKVAKETGAVIVSCCGFDSIPSDMLAHAVSSRIYARSATTLQVRTTVARFHGGASGGTIATIGYALGGKMPRQISVAKPPSPPKMALPTNELLPLYYDSAFKKWQGLWIMSMANSNVVKRSQSLINWKYDNYKYSKSFSYPNFIAAFLANASILVGLMFIVFPPTRWLLYKSNRFEIKSVGIGEDSTGKRIVVNGKWVGKSDPGYWQACILSVSAAYAAESALAFVYQRNSLPGVNELKGGVMTPAAAFGDVLLDRLRKTGTVDFQVTDA